jgi:hypothetical protein
LGKINPVLRPNRRNILLECVGATGITHQRKGKETEGMVNKTECRN